MIDIDNIFGKSDGVVPEEDVLIDFSSHPLYWIGGFNKIHLNKLYFTQYVANILKKKKKILPIDEIDKLGKELMYNKSWDFIKLIDVNNLFHIECLRLKSNQLFLENINNSISHFEKLEEYEKCGHLKTIQLKSLEFFP